MRFARYVTVILAKDLRAELRTKEAANAALAFALVILLLFNFAFDPSGEETRNISGGLLWLVFAFAGTLVLNRSYAREVPNDCLDGLIGAPISASAVFLGKALASFLLVLAIELISLPVFGIFYNVLWARQWQPLLLVLVVATWGLSVIGTMFSALTVNIRLRELMLPVLIYPIMVPELLGAMEITRELLAGKPLDDAMLTWFKLLIGFDIIFTALSVALIETVLVD